MIYADRSHRKSMQKPRSKFSLLFRFPIALLIEKNDRLIEKNLTHISILWLKLSIFNELPFLLT